MKSGRLGALALAPAFVAGCGGGSDSTPQKAATAEGLWSGTASTGYRFTLLVLDRGATRGVTVNGDGGSNSAWHGQTSSANGQWSGPATEFNLVTGGQASASYGGTYQAQNTLQAPGSGANPPITWSASHLSMYGTPASLAALAGNDLGKAWRPDRRCRPPSSRLPATAPSARRHRLRALFPATPRRTATRMSLT